MKSILKASLTILSFCLVIFAQNECEANDVNLKGARSVIERVLPSYAHLFELYEIPRVDEKDVFELDTYKNRIVIRGSSTVALCSGFNWYLRYYCNCHFSNGGSQLNIPYPLPKVPGVIRKVSPYLHSCYLNYCTYNYSMAFWNWERWEKEIDWMALNGINLPLATIGTETVWYNTLIRFGYSAKEVLDYISGPAYFAWWLTGHLEGWGGPVTQGYLGERAGLQQKILKRMRELGMQPVVPAFYGIVPNSLKKKFPNANIKDQGYWMGEFKRSAFLIPTDPLFSKMANAFYEEQKKLFGTLKYYSGMPIHVGETATDIDLKSVGSEIYNAMQAHSPGAVLVLQGWQGNPKDQLIRGLSYQNVLILDMDGDSRPQWSKRNGWSGYPWAWCAVNNYGGNTGLFSRLDIIASEPLKALNDLGGGYMVGIGALSENINYNPIFFELIYDMRWRRQPPDMKAWINAYARRRYRSDHYATQKAWELLHQSVYGKQMNPRNPQQGSSESILCARPSDVMKNTSTWGTSVLYYNPIDLVNALEHMLTVSPQLSHLDTYRYDLVDMTRQVLSNLAQRVHHRMMNAFEEKNLKAFKVWSDRFLTIIDDQDTLLNSRKEFMLGPWLEDAKAWGKTHEEKERYELNARSLITTWSFKDSQLREYAHREWSGLLKSYYKPRWKMFIDDLLYQLKGGVAKKVDYFSFEKGWTEASASFPVEPTKNAALESRRIYEKYSILIYSLYDTKRKGAKPMAYFQMNESSPSIANDILENAQNNLIKNGDFSITRSTDSASNWAKQTNSSAIYFKQVPYANSRMACFKSEGGNYLEQLLERPFARKYLLTFDLGYRRDEMVDRPIHFKVSLVGGKKRRVIDYREIEIKPPEVGIPQRLQPYEIQFIIEPLEYKELYLRFTNLTAVHPTWRATALLDNVCLVGEKHKYRGFEGKYVNEPKISPLSGAPGLGSSVNFSKNQNIRIPMDKALNTTNFSIALWAKPQKSYGYRAVISSRHVKQHDKNAAYGFTLFANPLNQWSFWTGWTHGDLWNWDVLIGPTFNEDKWSHIVIVFDGFDDPNVFGTVSGLKTIYVNGEKVKSAMQNMTPNHSGTLTIGSVSDSAFYFEGGVDDVQIYDGILTPNEVRWLYANPGKLIPDKIPPSISKMPTIISEAESPQGKKITLTPPVVHDFHDPEPFVRHNAPERFPLGVTEVKWEVSDASNNRATAIQKVIVKDTTAPKVSYVFNKLPSNGDGNFYQIQYRAEDLCDVNPHVSAILKVCNQEIVVLNGQVLKVAEDQKECLASWHGDQLHVSGDNMLLSIHSIDYSKNQSTFEKELTVNE